MKKIVLFSIAWFTLISAGELDLSRVLPIFNNMHTRAIDYLNQPYRPGQAASSTQLIPIMHPTVPTPTCGGVHTLQALGAGAGLTIVSSSLGRIIIKSALLAHFMTTAKPTLDGFINTKLSEFKQEKYQTYVPAATTGLSLLLACKFLY